MRAQCLSQWMIAGVAATTVAACGGKSKQEPMPSESMATTEPAPAPEPEVAKADCAIDIDMTGGTVRAMDIDGGVALVFAADTIDPATMRTRVHSLAESERGAGTAAGQGGATGAGVGNSDVAGTTDNTAPDTSMTKKETDPKTPDKTVPPAPGTDTTADTAGGTTGQDTYAVRETLAGVPAVATIVDTAMGAQLELRAQDPADVSALRAKVRENVDEISGGACQPHA